MLGVQWHPEADTTSPVVGAFVQAAAASASARTRRLVALASPSRARCDPAQARAVAAGTVHILGSVLRSRAIRATAWMVVAAGLAAPLLRKRVRAPRVALQACAFAAPLGLSVAMRRTRTRDVAVCGLQMWAYVAAYKTPHDDPEGQEQRTHFDYPIVADRLLGLGELPTVRLQRTLARVGPDGAEWRALDRVLVWTHWIVVRRAARDRRLSAAAPPGAVPASGRDDLRRVQPRRVLLLGGPHGSALVHGAGRASRRSADG